MKRIALFSIAIASLLGAASVGPPTNVQFMVKDSTKYAQTGGWRFAHFVNGKPDPAVSLDACFACHKAEPRDLVFTLYAP